MPREGNAENGSTDPIGGAPARSGCDRQRPGPHYADRVRALMIVNPRATTTTRRTRDVIVRALGSELDLRVAHTEHRDHAAELARTAVDEGLDMVVTLGGDGTVNEAVNGILRDGGPDPALPALAALPGGSANVFVRALGLPADPVEATGLLLEAIRGGGTRTVGLGRADERYFTFCAGAGLDAEVVRRMEGLRANGRRATPALYIQTAVKQFFRTDRRHPVLTIVRPDGDPEDADTGPLVMAIISNTAPWTYAGPRPVNPTPLASFDLGLDVFAMRRMPTAPTLNVIRQMLSTNGRPPSGRSVVSLHDEAEFAVRGSRPFAFQLDGEYLGDRDEVTFVSVPAALRVPV